MNSHDWLECREPATMLEFLCRRGSERKLQLLSIACCRRAFHLMTDSRHREAVENAERLVEGVLCLPEFEAALAPIVDLWANLPSYQGPQGWTIAHYMTAATRHLGSGGAAVYAASYVARGLASFVHKKETTEWHDAVRREAALQCILIRDLFGDPSRPFWFDPSWLAGPANIAVQQAAEFYRSGKFDDLSSLADKLVRADCRHQAVIDHCRSDRIHVRGCWVIDALLEYEPAVRVGLVTDTDWQTCADPEPLIEFLRDKGSVHQWRLFALACCRRIELLITDDRSRFALAIASRHAAGSASDADLASACAAAQQAVTEIDAEAYIAEAEANFSITPKYAAVLCRLYAAQAAHYSACPDPRVGLYGNAGEARHSGDAWAVAAIGTNVLTHLGVQMTDQTWKEAKRAEDAVEYAELKVHCDLLRELFAEYFGPPGKDAAWLPNGMLRRKKRSSQAEQWCLLPTMRHTATP